MTGLNRRTLGRFMAFLLAAALLMSLTGCTLPGLGRTAERNETPLPVSYVALVEVNGSIAKNTTSYISTRRSSYDHKSTLAYLDELMRSSRNCGILLHINSPGGTVYEIDELYLKLMEYKERTGRPIVAYCANQACSGGYYAAMAADRIVANRNSRIGSIGVIISFINAEGLYEKLGIEEVNIVSGPNKAMGSVGSELTDEQRQIYQGLVNQSYEQFLGVVADGRGMDIDTVRLLADGRIFTADQALEKGMIDEIATYDATVADYLGEFAPGTVLYQRTVEQKRSLVDLLVTAAAEDKTEAELVDEYLARQNSGVPMYYAE